jgi:hypothetical protein
MNQAARPVTEPAFAGPTPAGRRGTIVPAEPLPIEGSVEVELPVDRLWEIFLDVPGWSRWNPCIWRSRIRGGELREGATLVWAFNPIERRYLYKMPATAEIVEVVPADRVTWEVNAPGLHALHSYRFAALGPDRSRFGSWEVAEGAGFRAMRRFWLAHFRYVCRESLRGARSLGG